jgi:PPOX class probable F420-dependent enzyme
MAAIPDSARAVIESGALGHLVTLNVDGSPQVTLVWVGIEGGELLTGHLGQWRKVQNVQGNDRVVLSFETDRTAPNGLTEYLVIYGRARVQEGGAPALLQRLAQVYLGPGTKFPPMDNPPPGYVLRITPECIAGNGPWAAR